MTDTNENTSSEELEDQSVQELNLLKARAKQMGISFHPSIGVEKLKLKITNRLEGAADQVAQEKEPVVTAPTDPTTENKQDRYARLRREASRLVRVRVSCMNPNKTEYEGEIFTVSNSVVGTFKKYVAYNNDEGWHVPQMILNHLKESECQIFYTAKGPRGQKVRKGKMIKEFAIEIMDPLTSEQLLELQTQQAMANNLG